MAEDLTPHYPNLADWQANRSAELHDASKQLPALSRELVERSEETIASSMEALRRAPRVRP